MMNANGRETARCVKRLDSGSFRVTIGFAAEAGRPKSLYVGVAPDMPTAEKLRNVAELCRDWGRHAGSFTTRAEILDVWAICSDQEGAP